jgi:hypothetical protein
MLKKIGIAALAVVAGLFILNSTHLGGYAKTAWKKAKTAAKQQVPLEFQLENLRNEAGQLVPDMKNQLGKLAEETVAVQNLREKIVVTRTNLDKQKENIRTMKDDLKRGDVKVVYDNRPYSAERVRHKLALDLVACQNLESELKSQEKLLELREQALEADRQKLASMRSQKEQVEVEIAQMDADLRTLRLTQTRSSFEVDDSRLAHIKNSLADIRNQMKVEQTRNELIGEFSNDIIPVEKKAKTTEQLIREVEAFLNGAKSDSELADKR